MHEIGFAELMAGMNAILGGMLLASDANFLRMGIGGASTHRTAYEHRYGRPEQVGARLRNRFTAATFATENEAMASEMDSLNNRYSRVFPTFSTRTCAMSAPRRPAAAPWGNARMIAALPGVSPGPAWAGRAP